FRFRAPLHLLVAYQRGERTAGETFVEGLPPATLRDFAHRLTFVPAGHEYRECHESRTHSQVTFFYFDPALLLAVPASRAGDTQLAPRLLFENFDALACGDQIKQPAGARFLDRPVLFPGARRRARA